MSKARKVINSSLILIFSKLSERLLGLISTLILARLLMPEDFGIITMALLLIMFIETIVATGGCQYIIQKENINNDEINTSWTLDIILKVIVFILLLILTPFVSNYYSDPRLNFIIPILSIIIIFGAFVNPYINILRREQTYSKIFQIEIIRKILSVALTIFVALVYKNYWAIIIGHMSSSFSRLILSYLLISYRPRFSLVNIKEQWIFSRWMLSKNILGFSRSQLDVFLVSSFYNTSSLGAYHVNKYISNMPGTEVIIPAIEPLLATYSRSRKDLRALNIQIQITLLTIAFIAIPITAFGYTFSESIVNLLLGENWSEYSNLFAILALLIIPVSFSSISHQVLISSGRVKELFFYDLYSLALMAITLIFFRNYSLELFASTRVLIEWLIVLFLCVYTLRSIIGYKIYSLIMIFLICFFITMISAHLCTFIELTFLPDFFSLIIQFLIFFTIWVGGCFGFYKLYLSKKTVGIHVEHIIKSEWKRIFHNYK